MVRGIDQSTAKFYYNLMAKKLSSILVMNNETTNQVGKETRKQVGKLAREQESKETRLVISN